MYDIPNCVHDPDSTFNLLGIPPFARFFGETDDPPTTDEEGTWVRSGATRSVLTWDHGKHTRHFDHPSSGLPELTLFEGYSMWNAFCSRVRRAYDNTVHFAFCSAVSSSPIHEYVFRSSA